MVRLTKLASAAGSGVLLALAFPKADYSLLAWVAFVPLVWSMRRESPARAFAYGWIAGMGFYLCTVYWVVHAISLYSNIPLLLAVGLLLLMCAILASYTGAFATGLRLYQEWGGSIVLLGPLLWVALEWLRSFFFIGFPWVSLGYSQYRFLNLIQFAEFTAVYGISALVVFVNLVVFTVLSRKGRRSGHLLLTAALLVPALVGWGMWRRTQLAILPPDYHIRVGIIQGNIEQDKKWDPEYQEATLARYERLTQEAAARGVDLIVWPETAVPFFFQSDTTYRGRVLTLARAMKTPILFGSPAFQHNGTEVTLFNRAYLLSPHAEVLGSYDKIKLAPFGEYIPFQRILFFLDKLVEGIGNFAAGTTPVVFSLPEQRFGVLICYEGIFPELARRFVTQGAAFLVNITNDAWFGRTSAPYQHLVMEAMRTVENRVPMVRAANTGFSAVIGLDGRIHSRTILYDTAVLVEELSWPHVTSFYTQYGDVFAYLCALGASGMLGYAWYRQWRFHQGECHAYRNQREAQ